MSWDADRFEIAVNDPDFILVEVGQPFCGIE